MENNYFQEKYITSAENLNDFELTQSRTIECESPSNIALIKYWGKHSDQLPKNPSVSFALDNSKTQTSIVYRKSQRNQSDIEYFFEGKQNQNFECKVIKYLEKISKYQPFIKKLDLKIESRNTFPHSTGIASSASAFSALAICLCAIENDLFGTLQNEQDFNEKASFLARLGSGSASRSVYGQTVLWGQTDYIKGASNEIAIPIDQEVHHIFKSYYDAVLLVSSEEKALSSSKGHHLMQNHPFAKARYNQANVNLEKFLLALRSGGEKLFSEIVENEAMSLHALLLSSNPSVNLLKPNTLAIISKLKEFRNQHKLNFAFTLDAGPNIHILYPQRIRKEMTAFIEKELKGFCENEQWIDDKISEGHQLKVYKK